MSCLLTSMNSPLGRYAGNALEVLECVELMQGRGPDTTRDLTVELCAEMVHKSFPKRDPQEIRASLRKNLANGKAFDLFCKIARAQGGDTRVLEDTKHLQTARIKRDVVLPNAGDFVTSIDVRQLGVAIQTLGGGRRLMTDTIDHAVGLSNLKRVGESLAPKEPVATIHGNNESLVEQAAAIIQAAYQSGATQVNDPLMGERL
jgi:thymidine phosphorylase